MTTSGQPPASSERLPGLPPGWSPSWPAEFFAACAPRNGPRLRAAWDTAWNELARIHGIPYRLDRQGQRIMRPDGEPDLDGWETMACKAALAEPGRRITCYDLVCVGSRTDAKRCRDAREVLRGIEGLARGFVRAGRDERGTLADAEVRGVAAELLIQTFLSGIEARAHTAGIEARESPVKAADAKHDEAVADATWIQSAVKTLRHEHRLDPEGSYLVSTLYKDVQRRWRAEGRPGNGPSPSTIRRALKSSK